MGVLLTSLNTYTGVRVMNDRCRVDEETKAYLNAQELDEHRQDAIEDKLDEVRKTFEQIANSDDLDTACYWLSGAFGQEAIQNAIDILMGRNSEYFQTLIRVKAAELVDNNE